MIDALKGWLTSLVTVTLLLSLFQLLLPEGSLRRIGAFIGGLVLLVVLLRPVSETAWDLPELDWDRYAQNMEEQRVRLETENRQQLREIIEERTAAYISDKADGLGLTLSVHVSAAGGPEDTLIPAEAELTGPFSAELAVWIEEELGIPAERQVWHDGKN